LNAPDSGGVDTGTAYGRAKPAYRAELTQVGPGTPMGELLRRYWHPIALAKDANAAPKKLRVLGEDLILFRENGGAGRPGLLYPRCMHRGTTLYYGRVEERGIRCCYHGWLYDVQGHCLEQPCEPNLGERRDNVRQPWYPLEERYGLVFAYLGPPGKKPVLLRYDCLEELGLGEMIEADDTSIGSGGGVIVPCNWMQHYENIADPFHVPILHGAFSGVQFVEQMAKMPKVEFETSPRGVRITAIRKLDDGKIFRRITEAVLPTLRVIPNPRVGSYGRVESIGWVLPIDDTSFRIYTAGRVTQPGALGQNRSKMNGKYWWDLDEEEHRKFPGDWEAQTGQGAITLHSEEHLRTSDKGVALLRRLFEKQLAAMAAGGDPMLVCFDEETALVRCEAGNFLEAQR
jgi:phenylpropionate dioxygenase-like ring-hydroxylating dioxygenase large terminal subunit